MIAGFTLAAILVALATALAGAFVRGLAGFGMAILLVPVLALAIKPVEAVIVANWLGLFLGLKDLRKLLRNAEQSARGIVALAVVATPAGMAVLAATTPPVARLVIALIALGAFGTTLLPQREPHPPGKLATLGAGLGCGLLNGFAGMPGPPIVPYYLGRRIPPAVARASMMLVFAATSLAGIASASALGIASWRQLALSAALFPAVLIGDWLGHQAFGKVTTGQWRLFTGLVLAATAAAALLKLVQ